MWTPDPTIIITAEQKAAEQMENLEEVFRGQIQNHIDSIAKTKLYDSGNSMASYIASTSSQWAMEAQTFVAWRDAVWQYAYAELEKVKTGIRTIPTVEEFINELPVINWKVN